MDTPRSKVIRPSRREAEQDNEAFYRVLDHFRRRGDLPLEVLAHITADKTNHPLQNWSKRIASKSFTPEARRSILRYIFDNAQLLFGKRRKATQNIEDATFFAFLNLFNISDEAQDTARAQIVGTYKFWRHSAEHRGEYVYGCLEVFEDPHSSALKVRVRQAIQAAQGLRGGEDIFNGYMFCMPKMYFILLHGATADELRVIFLPSFRFGEVGDNPQSVFDGKIRHLVTLEGFAAGMEGSKTFFSPVHLSLVDDAEELAQLEGQLDLIRDRDQRMPERVANMLERNGPLRQLEPVSTHGGNGANPARLNGSGPKAAPDWPPSDSEVTPAQEHAFELLDRAAEALDRVTRPDLPPPDAKPCKDSEDKS